MGSIFSSDEQIIKAAVKKDVTRMGHTDIKKIRLHCECGRLQALVYTNKVAVKIEYGPPSKALIKLFSTSGDRRLFKCSIYLFEKIKDEPIAGVPEGVHDLGSLSL